MASSCVPLARSTSRVSDTRPPGRPPPNSISTPSGSATAGPGVASAITPARPRAAGRRPPRRGHGSRAARDSVGWGLVAAAAPLPPTIWDPKNPHDLIKTCSHSGYTVSVNDRIAAAAAAASVCTRGDQRLGPCTWRGGGGGGLGAEHSRCCCQLLGPTVRRCRWRWRRAERRPPLQPLC